jgi:xanthine dehydrogenase small subunit
VVAVDKPLPPLPPPPSARRATTWCTSSATAYSSCVRARPLSAASASRKAAEIVLLLSDTVGLLVRDFQQKTVEVPRDDGFWERIAPTLRRFWHRFAGLPVRNAGTLGGNIANGSPIGDSKPLLIALNARVVLTRAQGGTIATRELALEDLYTGYRANCMAADELLAWVEVPAPQPGAWMRVYKISKRQEDDISAVCLAIHLQLDAQQRVAHISIGAGGVAATPVRARQTEAALLGELWDQGAVQAAQALLLQEFSPISDMRASADYRRQVLGNLLQRFWLETQGQALVTLEALA